MAKRRKSNIEISPAIDKLYQLVLLKKLNHIKQLVRTSGTEYFDQKETALRKEEIYLDQIFDHWMVITDEFARLENLIDAFVISPSLIEYAYSSVGVSVFEFYRNSLELYHIKLMSILDYSAKFINKSLELGYPNRDCTLESISKNLVVKQTSIHPVIKEILKRFADHKRMRNIIIHEKQYESMELTDIDTTVLNLTNVEDHESFYSWMHQRRTIMLEKTVQKMKRDKLALESLIRKVSSELENAILCRYRIKEKS